MAKRRTVELAYVKLQRTFSISILSLTLPMIYDAVSIVWLCYELMIFAKINSLKSRKERPSTYADLFARN